MIWFTADWHVGHHNIIRHSNRPFANTLDMDRAIFNGLRKIRSGDSLYILGDIALQKRLALGALDKVQHGVQVFVVFGNHDRDHRTHILNHPRVVWGRSMEEVRVMNQHITLSHYAMRVWNRSHYGAWQLYGHSHNNLKPWDQQLDVGVDSAAKLLGEYRPFSFDEVQKLVREAPLVPAWREEADRIATLKGS